jgi:hypothetical protein
MVMTQSNAQMLLVKSLLNKYSGVSNWIINYPGIVAGCISFTVETEHTLQHALLS